MAVLDSLVGGVMAVAVGVVGVVGVGTAHAQGCDPIEVAKLLADDGEANDQFGNSVSISGDTAVIGVPRDDDNGSFSGSAYVFVRSGGIWSEQAKLLPTDGAAGDRFGRSVSVSGDTALVGAYFDNHDGVLSGSAYVFVRSGGVWTQQAKLLASDREWGDGFGWSVSIHSDTALIGASSDDDNDEVSGSAYVFVRNTGEWTQQAKLLAGDGTTRAQFGHAVSLDGDTALIGAAYDEENGYLAGAAYIFTRDGDTWTEQAEIRPANGADRDHFGYDVSIDGDTALIGSPRGLSKSVVGSVYVYTRDGSVWSEQAEFFESDGEYFHHFATSVSISGDRAVVGAYCANWAYVFTYDSGVWTERAKLLASDGALNDEFGFSVALDGDTALIGAHLDDVDLGNEGSAYVIDLSCIDCPADINGDGEVDTLDFLAFLGAWSAGDLLADWNGDGVVNTLDFLAYLTDWVAGCP